MSYPYQRQDGGESYDMNQTNYGNQYRDDPNSYGSGGNGHQYPMSSGNAVAGSSPYALPQKKKRNKWLWIGLPIILIAVIVGAVVGGVVGSRNAKSNNNVAATSNGGSDPSNGANGAVSTNSEAGAGSTATGANGNEDVYLAVATDTYMLPEYPSATATSGYSAPTVVASPSSNGAWPADPDSPSSTSPRAHPRLIAPAYKWNALRDGLIANDPYLKSWNATIIANATSQLEQAPEGYVTDGGVGGSGVLDVARRIKLKVKNWSYAYRMTNDTKFLERVWTELETASGNNNANVDSQYQWPTNGTQWNAQHFLDLAEFCNAFAIAYDWLYDGWTQERRDSIRNSITTLGLSIGLEALQGQGSTNWWTGTKVGSAPVNGNWNCVINGGLTMAALAIQGDDTTGIAEQVIALSVPNAKDNCMLGAYSDGTWAESPNYWYFGTTAAAEMVSALVSAYGSDQGLLENNSGWNNTSLYHMYVQGMTSLFNYGDHGPNKYSSTANSLLFFGDFFNEPRYALYQRDHYDASEPWSMFWYNPAITGAWWDGLALDRHFDNWEEQWVSMRSSWTNNDGTYVALKNGYALGHQTHGDLDIGDFVIDALGQRWAGELGSGQYLAPGYFTSEAQDAERWLYYRKRTEGQNTLVLDYQNQVVTGNVTATNFGTTGEAQGPAPGWPLPGGSTAFYTVDMSPAYNGTLIKRGIRMLNDRKQILIQDDVNGATSDIQWRMHTNATMSFDSGNTTATLSLGGQTLQAIIVNGPEGAAFQQLPATRYASDPALPTGPYSEDLTNDPTTVLAVTVAGGGTFSLQVLFNPQYEGATSSSYITPKNVPIDSWTIDSHNA